MQSSNSSSALGFANEAFLEGQTIDPFVRPSDPPRVVLATVLTLGFVPVMYTLLFRIPTRDAVAATLYNG